MSEDRNKYDKALCDILVEQKSIIGFLSTVFDFLARRTDFYYVPEGPYENTGFPPGVAEELTVKVLRRCDPKRSVDVSSAETGGGNMNDDIMCSTVAQEVELVAEGDEDDDGDDAPTAQEGNGQTATVPDVVPTTLATAQTSPPNEEPVKLDRTQVEPPQLPPAQRNSEAYNGAVRDNYSWAQTIMDLDVTIRLPAEVRSSKDLRVNITGVDLCVSCAHSENIILKGTFSYKVKANETYWSLSKGQLLVHLEKQQERWWNALITSEEPIDLSKIDCSRPLDELPEDQVAKVRELQWNHERKLMGLPTSEEMRNMDILKKAWNLDGSPFKGTELDPTILQQ